ncbi:29039_t:CDS:2 [Gigaspora margarita]|uniref:29039_t:CDS:1 n=1 Tax=Gigaspora margarita TaxID=4874 RepID=A0ABN7VYW1_GIGMA|nr:29039_t:CDS:2 [Gigaspora margarita]
MSEKEFFDAAADILSVYIPCHQRTKAAEYSIDKIIRNIERKKKDIRDKSCYRRLVQTTDVKNKFEQLRDDFEKCMADLNFAIVVSNEGFKYVYPSEVDMSGKELFDTADILTIYIPPIGANAECNKELCLIMIERVKAAEYSIDKKFISIEKKKEDFQDKYIITLLKI